MEHPIESFTFREPSTSPRNLSPVEKDQLADFESSQQQDDDIRMMLQSDQQRATKTAKEQEQDTIDPETEFKKEKHMLNDG